MALIKLKFIICFLFLSAVLLAQENVKIKALNNYVDFANESTHGLLIIHRLLENFNQEINKYVDLPGYKINNISNKDLPSNIFEDKDHWFYDPTPYELYEELKNTKSVLEKEEFESLFSIANNIFNTENKINAIRFTLADMIAKVHQEDDKDLNQIYELLEKAVDLYDLIFAYTMNLRDAIDKITNEKTDHPVILLDWYAIDILLSIRAADYDSFNKKIDKLDLQIGATLKYLKQNNTSSDKIFIFKIIPALKNIINLSRELKDNATVSEFYKLYGKDYFYYNIKVIDKYNRYGNGYINYLNNIIRNEFRFPKRIEYPHYFKVIYPNKLVKKIEFVESKNMNIFNLPDTLSGRKVESINSHKIKSDKYDITIKLFDHKIQDGDIISINFNNEWIYKKLSLETKPKELNIKLNETGKNFMILHAENVGRMPPNTIGIEYTYKNEKKRIILQSDMKVSEMVEFEVD